MHKHRVLIFLISIFGVIGITWLLIQLGNGYRPNIQNKSVDLTGLLVTNSEPKGAQVYVDGQVKTATDDTLSLEPGTYTVELKKNGFFHWSKTLKIEPSLVTQTNALLFPSTTDLKAITYTGVINPTIAPNNSRLVYAVSDEATSSASSTPETGIWILELSDLPLRFNRDPQQLVSGLPERINPSEIKFKWSFDSQEIIILVPITATVTPTPTPRSIKKAIPTPTPDKTQYRAYKFPLNNELNYFSNEFIEENYQKTLNEWATKANMRTNTQLSDLPILLRNTLSTTSADLTFSPDETKIMYTATQSAQLENQYISTVLSASTQPENRKLEVNHRYIYDLKEDKNFDITSSLSNLNKPQVTWFPSSRHLVISTLESVHLLEYDNTNFTTIYSGPLSNDNVFPHPSANRVLIQTSLNPKANKLPNLYAIILR